MPMRRSFARLLRRTLVLLLVLAIGTAVLDVLTYHAADWLRDYRHLKHELAHRYANLDWIVEHRGLDLAALDRRTESELANAHSHLFATLALRRFVRAFDDPHLRIVWGHRAPTASLGAAPHTAPAPALEAVAEAGYELEDRAFRFPFDRLPGWTTVGEGPFPIGHAHDLGVLRIASFGEDRYRDVAERAFAKGMDRRALQLATRVLLQQHLREAIATLRQRGVRRLVVDVTGNGGGTEWVVEVVALFTDRELTRRRARRLATGVDRSGIFAGQPVSGVLAEEGEPVRLSGTGAWTGPLFVLVDGGTGSAAEDFVVWLQENGVAKVLGERTAGAGGGYVDGGGWIALTTAPFDVRAPNCARFLRDGTNEIEGIAPDVPLPIHGAAAAALAVALAKAAGG